MGRSTLLARARELAAHLPTALPRAQELLPRPRRSPEADGARPAGVGAGRPAEPSFLTKFGASRTKPQPPRWRRSPEPEEPSSRWRSRPVLAAGLKLLVVLIPAAAAIGATALLNWGVPTPDAWAVRIGWWLLLLAVSTVVALAVERQSRRLLPLAVLFKLTLLFPDEAPSRYRMARAAGNPQKLKELAHGTSPRSRAATHVLAWVAQLSRHDRHTRGHSERVRVYADLIAEQLKITGTDRDKLRWAALLHDIGKLRVPATVLNKPSKPNDTEWDVLRQHPAAGMVLIGPLAEWLGEWAGGVADHHERYDGTGYPNGLAGENISLSGRIVAVADAYETMTAARSYKRAMAAAAGRAELARCAGSHFDPVVVRAFLAVGLPRLLYGIGPISFLVHLPWLSRIPEAGYGMVAVAGQAAAPVAAGLTAASVATATMVGPMSAPTLPGASAATVTATSSTGSGSTVSRSLDRATVSATRSAKSNAARTKSSGSATSSPGNSGSAPGKSKGKSPNKNPTTTPIPKGSKGSGAKAPTPTSGRSATKEPKAPKVSTADGSKKPSGSTSGTTGNGRTKGPKQSATTSTASSKTTGSGKSK